jgi:hypothetical protein
MHELPVPAGASSAAATGQTLAAIPIPPFKPSGKQLRFLAVYMRHLEEEPLDKLTEKAVLAEAGIAKGSLWTWKKNPQYVEWMSQQVRALGCSAADWELVKAVMMRLAKQGSLSHAEFLLKLREIEAGWTPRNDQAPGVSSVAGAQPTIIINLPRPAAALVGRDVRSGMFSQTPAAAAANK